MQERSSFRCFVGLCLAALCFWTCGTTTKPPDKPEVKAIEGTQLMMDFGRAGGFYDAPFPSEDLRGADGTPELKNFPNPEGIELISKLLDVIHKDVKGFSTTAAIYFRTTAKLGAAFPSPTASMEADSPVFLLDVAEGSRHPISCAFHEDGGPFGAANLFSILPVQGFPLQPNKLYVAVVMRKLQDAAGKPLGVSLSMAQLAAEVTPAGLSEAAAKEYKAAVAALKAAGIKLEEIAALTVFRTGEPLAGMRTFLEAAQKETLPGPLEAFKKTEQFDDYCVYESHLNMPVYQEGKPPFTNGEGGGWASKDGKPVRQALEKARILVTLPRGKAMPASGFPTVVFVRTGGGGDRPLVERGVRAKSGGPAVTPGSGPAMNFARAGFAGVSVDGPHGGLRNISKSDEQFLIFNVTNPYAMRDNIRQSALELALLPKILAALKVDASDCEGLAQKSVVFDTKKLALMGHSMGATISPLVLAFAPAFGASILSGAGGSWIANIVHKKSPLDVRPLAEGILRYTGIGRTLHEYDPALTLLQWAGEPADPPPYALALRQSQTQTPPHILMLQGIVDTYILPPIANSLSLAFGLDLAGPILDKTHEKLQTFVPLEALLPLHGKKPISLPASGNLKHNDKTYTGLVIQHLQGPVEDGHEVVFQTQPPKHQYRCFLESFAKGEIPSVPQAKDDQWAPCQ